ncbi:TPA: hypothetical protein ACH3X2_002952 [Trebouxia sp. C0005]
MHWTDHQATLFVCTLYRRQSVDATPEAGHQHLNPASLVAKGSVMLLWCCCITALRVLVQQANLLYSLDQKLMAEQQDELQSAAETPLPEACLPAAPHINETLADSFQMNLMSTHLHISQIAAPQS